MLITTRNWLYHSQRKKIMSFFWTLPNLWQDPHACPLPKLDHNGKRWTQPFISNWKQYVILDCATSCKADILSGAPQGTVLSPMLFQSSSMTFKTWSSPRWRWQSSLKGEREWPLQSASRHQKRLKKTCKRVLTLTNAQSFELLLTAERS